MCLKNFISKHNSKHSYPVTVLEYKHQYHLLIPCNSDSETYEFRCWSIYILLNSRFIYVYAEHIWRVLNVIQNQRAITHLAFKPGLGHHHSGPQPITVTPHCLEWNMIRCYYALSSLMDNNIVSAKNTRLLCVYEQCACLTLTSNWFYF